MHDRRLMRKLFAGREKILNRSLNDIVHRTIYNIQYNQKQTKTSVRADKNNQSAGALPGDGNGWAPAGLK